MFIWIIIIIIIAAFIMRTYPSIEDVQGATVLLPRSLDTISRPHLQCTISTPKGAIPCRAAYIGVSGKYIHNISFTSYRVPIYTPGWRAAMWIKCVAEGQKCQALTGSNPEPFDPESRGHSNIPRHLTLLEEILIPVGIFCTYNITMLVNK